MTYVHNTQISKEGRFSYMIAMMNQELQSQFYQMVLVSII
jgi:hypothetical protein